MCVCVCVCVYVFVQLENEQKRGNFTEDKNVIRGNKEGFNLKLGEYFPKVFV